MSLWVEQMIRLMSGFTLLYRFVQTVFRAIHKVCHAILDPGLDLCADVIVSAVARRSISGGGGGAPPVPKNRRGRPKSFVIRFTKKISFYPQNFLRNLFSHQSFEVCR